MNVNHLTGQWRLLVWRRVAEDGSVTYPFGEDASGLLIYTAGGHMAVQMTAGGRPVLETGDPLGGSTEQRAAAYSTYLAYFGSYEVQGTNVVHRIDGSSFPNWSETVQVRPFTRDGEELVLRTPPVKIGSVEVVNEMSWIRDGHSDTAAHPSTQAKRGS